MNDALLILCSVPDLQSGRLLADVLLEEKAAACVSILPGVESHYVWQGKREQSGELLLLVKTMEDKYLEAEELIRENHPYECPEILAISASQVSPAYLAWLKNSTRSD
ncbi:MAG: divalent-cation tolerance protein CutA [Verrucomicrobiales bacterium]|jgi:periplasmic divalent cation tolerance protein|nr:divalent-cation tolerance protein CutA [Verrucomicrobiales bacterium]